MKALLKQYLLLTVIGAGLIFAYWDIASAVGPKGNDLLQAPLMESSPKDGLSLRQLMQDAMPGSKPVACLFVCQLQKTGQVGCMTPPVFCREIDSGLEKLGEETKDE